MKPMIKNLLFLTMGSALGLPGAALATNGYFMPGYGAKSLGMGGVGIAYAQDSLAAGANPAGIADVGTRVDIGMALFNPERRSAVSDPAPITGFGFEGDSWSKNRHFLIPNAGMTMQWDDKFSIGIAALGNGGMNSTFERNFFNFSGSPASKTVGIDMIQLLVPITGSWRIDEEHAVGVSIVFARQRFSARGLESFKGFGISSDPDHLTGKGSDYANGYGFRFGWRGKFLDEKVTLGATYATRVEMGKFAKYRGLFPDAGGFDIPANYGVGIALKPTESVNVAFDFMRINYSGIPSIGNTGPNKANIPALGQPDSASKLTGLPAGMGFGWQDQKVFKLGVDWKVDSKLTLRTGYNYGKSPIPNDQLTFNLLAPATVEKHYTVGFTYNIDSESELTMSYLHAMRNKQSGCGFVLVDCVAIEMSQRVLDISYAVKW